MLESRGIEELEMIDLPTNDNPYSLIEGDCIDVMKTFESDSIDLTVTSPPYDNLRTYKGYSFDFEGVANELYRVTKPGGVVVWVVGDQTKDGSESGTSFRQALYFRDVCGFKLYDTMIYRTHKMPMNDRRYQACFEYMFVLSKGRPNTFNPIMVRTRNAGKNHSQAKYRGSDGLINRSWVGLTYKETKIKDSIWFYGSGNGKSTTDTLAFRHPAIFPEGLARDHITSWSNPGDVVLDPFCGSGTTGKMALLEGRRFIGIDVSGEYLEEIARPRIEAAIEQRGLFNNSEEERGDVTNRKSVPI